MKNAQTSSLARGPRTDRRTNLVVSVAPIDLIIDLERQDIFHNSAIAEWRAAVKLVHAEISKITRSGDVVMPKSPERVIVTLHGVEEADAQGVADRLENSLNDIALNPGARVLSTVRVAQLVAA